MAVIVWICLLCREEDKDEEEEEEGEGEGEEEEVGTLPIVLSLCWP